MDVGRAPRRSAATRTAILDAARRRFAADGYQRATIRAIAADAGIDPSMVMRYYGSKNRLFAAAVDVDLRLPDLEAVVPERLGEVLIRHFLTWWEHPPGNETLLTLLRCAVTDPDSVAGLQQIFAEQVTPAVLRLGDPADAACRAGLVATQILGLALCRYVLRLPPVAALTPTQLITEIAPTIQRYLASTPSGCLPPTDEAVTA
ncbi:MAG: TetR family transcriptional regulator [Pseudonocardiales bacterium]|nr:TetR family transcriptional regulator [Pseudonocardiales bacterium]MBV9031365.1 TetR family transcriptional regulator [Pseudonocardiales bacterium]MBW0011330.1 TetR family transcriptional regulator [Pseudonocardiales bacterium]